MAHGTVGHGTVHITTRQCMTMVIGEEGIIRLIIILHIITDLSIAYLMAETTEVLQCRRDR
jgi:hypothetical protein